jgi:Tfp pilus assembly protein PilF
MTPDGDQTPAHARFAQAMRAHKAGRLAEAEQLYRQVLGLDPGHVESLQHLGVLAKQAGRADLAADLMQKAIALRPDYAEAHYNLGVVLGELGRRAEAAGAFERAIALRPNIAEAHYNLGNALKDLNRLEAATEAYLRAVDLKPDFIEALFNLGMVRAYQGDLAEAARRFLAIIALQPDHVQAHYQLADLSAAALGSNEAEAAFARLAVQAENLERFDPAARARLLFAMAKSLEDRGEYDQAFDCMARANALHRAGVTYDIAEAERGLEAIARAFDAPLLERLAGAGETSERPVFILGLPRSGTSLVEQILGAHPAVQGAGEIANLPAVVSAVKGPGGAGFPDWAQSLTARDCRAIGGAYLRGLPAPAPGKTRLTDKWLYNFRLVGLIRLALPNARIIHCRRDPRDAGLSAFAISFAERQDHTYDLTELGRYWRAYDRLMAHWRAVPPPEAMLEVPYEALVADLETWARRLVAWCGLDWDEACLKFHQSGQAVRTASLAQVRQPIYASSVGRWRRFERHLGPLLEALGPPWNAPDVPLC